MNSSCPYGGTKQTFGILSKALNDIWLSEKSPFFDRSLVGSNRILSASIPDQSDAKSVPPHSNMQADARRVLDEVAFLCGRFTSISLPAGAIYDAGP
jgi:hypothetical protein